MSRTGGRLGAALCVLAVLATGCAGAEEGSPRQGAREFPLTVSDDEGVEVTLRGAPRRIVTFAPSHTEIVFALGLGDRLVGVSGPFDDFPPEAAEVEPVGGAGGVEPNVEKVVSLEPDIVLTAFIGGDWKERLRELDVPVFTTLASDLPDAIADIETLGRVLGVPEEAGELADDMEGRAEEIEAGLEDADPVSCFLDLGDLFTVGPGALEFDLLERAGCEPITASADDPYPQWSVEQLVEDDPDVYLVSEGVPVDQATSRPGVRDLTAVQEGRVHPVDADLVSRPGPRLVEGIGDLAAALHPDAES